MFEHILEYPTPVKTRYQKKIKKVTANIGLKMHNNGAASL